MPAPVLVDGLTRVGGSQIPAPHGLETQDCGPLPAGARGLCPPPALHGLLLRSVFFLSVSLPPSLFRVCRFLRFQERAKVDAERKELQRLRTLYTELERQLDNCPESLREQLQDQVQRVSVSSPTPILPPPAATGARDATPRLPGLR